MDLPKPVIVVGLVIAVIGILLFAAYTLYKMFAKWVNEI